MSRLRYTRPDLGWVLSMRTIPSALPSITEREIAYVTDAVRTGWGSKCLDYVRKLERGVEQTVGASFAIATNSCSSALQVALAALDVGPGDEVILPESTWVACAASVVHSGATPVFADIERDTWCISPASVEAKITGRTKVVMAVDLYGHVADFPTLRDLTTPRNIAVLEDSAQAFGASLGTRKAGSLGDFSTFSFHGTKAIAAGEGGMLLTSNPDLHAKAKLIASQGIHPDDPRFWARRIGYKTAISNLVAAMACAQVERAEELIAKRRTVFSWYKARLADIPGLTLNTERPGTVCTFWHPTVVCADDLKVERPRIERHLQDHGIATRPFFAPLSSMPMFKQDAANVVAYKLGARGLNLPSYFDLTEADVDFVCEILRGALRLTS